MANYFEWPRANRRGVGIQRLERQWENHRSSLANHPMGGRTGVYSRDFAKSADDFEFVTGLPAKAELNL